MALPRLILLPSMALKEEMLSSVQRGWVGMMMSMLVRLVAQSKLARRGELGGDTARMVPKPRVEFAGSRDSEVQEKKVWVK